MMDKIDHIYVEINGRRFNDFIMYSDNVYGLRYLSDSSFGLNSELSKKLYELDSFVDPNIRPAKQTEIYVAPDCPLAIDDIRNHYKLKRGIDSGKCNVINPLHYHNYNTHSTAITTIIVPSKFFMICSYREITPIEDLFTDAGLDINQYDRSEFIINHGYFEINFYKDKSNVFRSLLEGKVKKPCIKVEQLDLNAENELTLDMLQLVYTAGNTDRYQQDAMKNYILQLNVLNQHNWREYPGTICLLLCNLVTGVGRDLRFDKRSQSKTIQALFSVNSEFASEKDFNMAQAFVDQQLHIGKARFADTSELIDKVSDFGMYFSTFNKLFNTVTKITPKQYIEESEESEER